MWTLDDVRESAWHAQQHATLLFVVRDGQVLLIHKKRGLGAGKINGPGGRLEPGETPKEAAIREINEELCVDPVGVREVGELSFQFLDGLSIYVNVFKADDCVGEAEETDEAIPRWTPIDQMPYEQMWADDAHWVPLMLAETPFCGYFLFDDEVMVDYVIEKGSAATRLERGQGRGA